MALDAGSVKADAGMSLAIYTQLDVLLSPPLQAAVDAADGDAKEAAQAAMDAAKEGWKKLSYAIAKGVVEHIKTALEINGVTVAGKISVPVDPNKNYPFAQTNNGTGRVA